MSRLRKIASYEPVYKAFSDYKIFEKFKFELDRITDNVLDDIIGNESVDDILEKIVDRAVDPDNNIYNLLVDYISDNKIEENELPTEDEIQKIIEEKVEDEVNFNTIEEAIEEMKEVNGDDGVSRDYWDSRF